MRRAMLLFLTTFVVLASVGMLALAVLNMAQGGRPRSREVVQVALALLGLGSPYFYFKKTRLLVWVHLLWWAPLLIQVKIVTGESVVWFTPGIVWPVYRFYAGWVLERGGLLLIGLDQLVLVALVLTVLCRMRPEDAVGGVGTK